MITETTTIGSLLACLLFCPTPGLPFGDADPRPTLRGTPFDCKIVSQEMPAAQIWLGRFSGLSHFGDRTRGVSLVGCFPREADCQFFLDRMDGYMFGRTIQRSCRQDYHP